MNSERAFFENNSVGQVFYSKQSYKDFLTFTTRLIEKSINEYEALSTALFSSNIAWRKDVLGNQSFCTTDSSRRRLYVWRKDFDTGTLWIISGGNGRGTTYEWYSSSEQYGALFNNIMDYLFEIYELSAPTLDVWREIS